MDCRTCQPTLIDLLHGELATDAAEEAQAHLEECASCRNAFDKLSQGLRVAQRLPLLEPPQAVGARLMQLAEEHASAAAALRRTQPRKSLRPWQSLLEFVGRFAMARQVGMATLMLLIVAVGMWSLPQLQRSRVADGGTVVSPEPTGEAAPSVVHQVPHAEPVAPAAPVAAAVPDEANAEGDTEAVSETRAASTPAPAASAETARASGRRASAGPSKEKREAEAFPDSLASAESAAKRPAPARAKSAVGRGESDDDPLAGLSASRDSAADRAQPSAAPAPPLANGYDEGKKAGGSARMDESPCGPARMRQYQQIIDAAPTSPAAGEAMLAMARCHARNGEHTLARALLERAARNTHVGSRAKAMLDASAQPAKPAAPAAAEPAAQGARP